MQYVKFCYLLRIYLVNSKKVRTFATVSISKVTFSLRINQRSLSCGCTFWKVCLDKRLGKFKSRT